MCTLCTIILTKNEEKDIEGAVRKKYLKLYKKKSEVILI